MNELLSAILDLSRLEAAVLKPDVRPLVLETIFDRLRRRFTLPARDKGLGMRIRPCRATILSDPAMLERILANLTANAVQHTLRGRVLVGCRRKGTDLHIGIWDTGPGIVPEQIPEIFKEYHQLHNAARNRRQGLGLGLAIVDRLARLLRHRIEVRSTPGKGPCSLSWCPSPPPEEWHEEKAKTRDKKGEDGRPARSFNILRERLVVVIDDDSAGLDGMRALLASLGCRAVLAETPAKALSALGETPERPDLIIADDRLRDGLTGVEAIACLRRGGGPPAGWCRACW